MQNNYCGNFVASSHTHNRHFWCYSVNTVKPPRCMLTLHALRTGMKASGCIIESSSKL